MTHHKNNKTIEDRINILLEPDKKIKELLEPKQAPELNIKKQEIIAFNRRDGAYLISANGTTEKKISRNRIVTWSNNGNKIILRDNPEINKKVGKYYIIDFSNITSLDSYLNINEFPLHHNILNYKQDIHFNEKGSGIIYLQKNALYYLTNNNDKRIKLKGADDIFCINENINISPNGKYVAVMHSSKDNSAFKIISISDNEEIPLATDLGNGNYAHKILGWINNEKVIFRKDGSLLIVDINKDTREEIEYQIPSESYSSMPNTEYELHGLSPDSNKILMIEQYGPQGLFIFDIKSKKFNKLQNILDSSTNECWLSNQSWSSNNKSFVIDHMNHSTEEYSDPKNWDIYIFDSEKSKPRLLVENASDSMWRP